MTALAGQWNTDVLGQDYEVRTIPLPDDDEGEVVATLVRRRRTAPTRRAVLYVHGFVDYFFQAHLADHYVENGWDFYALDLRKYGRSLRLHQTPNYVADLADYFVELDQAAHIIRHEDGHDVLLVNAHSTGGLITPLWADARRDTGAVDGIFLNSPFLELNANWTARNISTRAVEVLAKRRPYQQIRSPLTSHYVHSIHRDFRGTWSFDLNWKPEMGFPVTAGWLTAVRRGHRRIADGLGIDVPILVMSSTSHIVTKNWDERLRTSDAVLNADDIAQLAPRLGRHVTVVRIEGGVHDLVLSDEAVRKRVFDELDRWSNAYLPQ